MDAWSIWHTFQYSFKKWVDGVYETIFHIFRSSPISLVWNAFKFRFLWRNNCLKKCFSFRQNETFLVIFNHRGPLVCLVNQGSIQYSKQLVFD